MKVDNKERALAAWLNNPLDTAEEIAKKAGIGTTTFYRFRKDEEFMAKYHQAQQLRFSSLEGKAIEKLNNQIDNDNWNAIKYVLDASGYKPTDKLEVKQTTINVSVEDE